MTSDAEKSFKAKIRAIAKEKNREAAELWQTLALERFLVRLANSRHRDHFILKGGILLSKYIEIGRETIDIDFLARKISNEVSKLQGIFKEIATIDLRDGFSFKDIRVVELAHTHMGYTGIEASMVAHFGRTRCKITIDVGFGDVIDPIKYPIPLTASTKGHLFEENIELSCYPKEFIFAEKLETIVYRGSLNSRMKDFHDLYSMLSARNFSLSNNLEMIIQMVFEHRGTQIILPISYGNDGMQQLQNYWNQYLKHLRKEVSDLLPEKITDVISKINKWLKSNTGLIKEL